jgi:hypothetical protein
LQERADDVVQILVSKADHIEKIVRWSGFEPLDLCYSSQGFPECFGNVGISIEVPNEVIDVVGFALEHQLGLAF